MSVPDHCDGVLGHPAESVGRSNAVTWGFRPVSTRRSVRVSPPERNDQQALGAAAPRFRHVPGEDAGDAYGMVERHAVV